MALGLPAVLAWALLSIQIRAEIPDLTHAHTSCHSLLQGASASGYDGNQLSMLCRARLPMEVCRDAMSSLGELPWTPARINSTCKRWTSQWRARALANTTEKGMNFSSESMQATLDALMKEKASVGLCKGNDGEKMSFDQCTQYKQYAYPKYHAQMNEMLHEKTNTSSMPSDAEPQQKYGMGGGELGGARPFADKAAGGGRARLAASGLAVAVPLAVAALLTLRRGRWAAPEHSLLSDSGSDSELPAE